MATTAVTAVTSEKVGFGTRFLAILIDGIGLGIVGGIITGVLYAGDTTAGTGLQTLLGVALASP